MHQFNHAAFAPKRWNGTETVLGLRYGDCRFLPNANCGEKKFELGAKREGRSGFWKQDIFFFGLRYLLGWQSVLHANQLFDWQQEIIVVHTMWFYQKGLLILLTCCKQGFEYSKRFLMYVVKNMLFNHEICFLIWWVYGCILHIHVPKIWSYCFYGKPDLASTFWRSILIRVYTVCQIAIPSASFGHISSLM